MRPGTSVEDFMERDLSGRTKYKKSRPKAADFVRPEGFEPPTF